MKTQHIKNKLSLLLFALILLVTMVCSLTVAASAQTQIISINQDDLEFGLEVDSASLFYKVYDGSREVPVTLKKSKAELGIAEADDVTVVATAVYNSQNVNEANYITVSLSLVGADASRYQLANTTLAPFGAYIAPKTLTWKNGGEHSLSVNYNPEATVYDLAFDLPELSGLVENDGTQIPKGTISVQTEKADAEKAHTQLVSLDLGANYTVAPLTVKVTVSPIVISEILWEENYIFNLGDENASALVLNGTDANGKEYRLNCVYPENYAKELGEFLVKAEPMNSNFIFADSVHNLSKNVHFIASEYTVSMDSAVYVGNQSLAQNPTVYMLAVSGDLPAAIRNKILYTVDGNLFEGTADYGVYTVVATLPSDIGCVFVDTQGNEITELQATLTVNQMFVSGTAAEDPYAITVSAVGGVSPALTATVTSPAIDQKALKNFGYYKGYAVSVSGSADGAYTIRIALLDEMFYAGKAPTVNDLYLYDSASGSLKKVTETENTVTLGEGYYEISNLKGDAEWIFVFASEKAMTFWLTAPGLALILLLLFAIVALLFFVGFALIRSHKAIVSAKAEKKPVQEPVKEEPKVVIPAQLPEQEKPGAQTYEEQELVEEEELAEESGFDMKYKFTVEFEDESPTADQIVDELADQTVNTLEPEVEAEIEEPLADAAVLDAAVASALEETLNTSADASNAAEIVEEFAEEAEEPVEEAEEPVEEAEEPAEEAEESVEEAEEPAEEAEEPVEEAEESVEEAEEPAEEAEEPVEEAEESVEEAEEPTEAVEETTEETENKRESN